MPDFDNTNRGILFVNDKREKDTHPNYKGSINVGGVEYWIDGWAKETSKGRALSLSIKPKDAQRQVAPIQPAPRPVSRPAPSRPQIDDDSDIPF